MTRRALIIGSPDKDIPGVLDDMKNYRAFLKSFAGGAWFDQEIIALESPAKLKLFNELELLKSVDYSFVVFAGHGGYLAYHRATMLKLNSSAEISENDLKVGAPKRTVIIDACRVHVDKQPMRESVKAALAMDSYRSADQSRAIFDRSIEASPPGLVVLYGCSVGEGAGETAGIGGRYSCALLEVAGDWVNDYYTQRGTAFSVSDAHEKAADLVRKRSGESQNPKGEFPRALPRFPLAVKA